MREHLIRARKASIEGNTLDYNRFHTVSAMLHRNPENSRVLVVGCNRGEDCKHFVEFGAALVTGLDIMAEIGENFKAPNVSYVQASAEEMPFPDRSFDIVFCFATMEHVLNIEKAFGEMARVTDAHGLIYSIAAPLWNSRSGPHWGGVFDSIFPWIHLRLSPSEIVEYCDDLRVLDESKMPFSSKQIEYFLSPLHFNQRPAKDYIAACNSLNGVEIIKNAINLEDSMDLPESIERELVEKGYDNQELYGLVHEFVAKGCA